jgi:hypothetical protein
VVPSLVADARTSAAVEAMPVPLRLLSDDVPA